MSGLSRCGGAAHLGTAARYEQSEPEIFKAIADANVDEVVRLCHEGVDWKAKDHQGRNALILAEHQCGQATDNPQLANRRAQVLDTVAYHGGMMSRDRKENDMAGAIANGFSKLSALVGACFASAGLTALGGKVSRSQDQHPQQNKEKPAEDVPLMRAFPVGRDLDVEVCEAEKLAGHPVLECEPGSAVRKFFEPRTISEAYLSLDQCKSTLESIKPPINTTQINCVGEYRVLHTHHALRLQGRFNPELRTTVSAHNARQKQVGVAMAAAGSATLVLSLAACLAKRWFSPPGSSSGIGSKTKSSPTAAVVGEGLRAARAAQPGHVELQPRLAPSRSKQSDQHQP